MQKYIYTILYTTRTIRTKIREDNNNSFRKEKIAQKIKSKIKASPWKYQTTITLVSRYCKITTSGSDDPALTSQGR